MKRQSSRPRKSAYGTPKSPLAAYRARMKGRGMVRVEVHVRKDDAVLIRALSMALADPERGAQTRALLQDELSESRSRGLKALLEAAPLEGIELERTRDLGRHVDL